MAMSEQSEKLVKIILSGLLNYLEMVESGEIIERRLKEKDSHFRKNDNENNPSANGDITKYKKI